MDDFIKEFQMSFNELLHDFRRNIPDNKGVNKTLEVFNNLSIEQLMERFYTTMLPHEEELAKGDISIFSETIKPFPGINMKKIFPKLTKKSQESTLILFRIMFVSAKVYTDSKVTINEEKKVELDPFVGVGSKNDDYNVDDMYENYDLNIGKDGFKPNFKNLIKLMGVDKYFNVDLDNFSDELKGITHEEIENASSEIRSMIGGTDEQSSVITDMLASITNELKERDIQEGDPFEHMLNIAESVAKKMRPQFINDPDKLLKSVDSLTKNLSEKNGLDMGDMNKMCEAQMKQMERMMQNPQNMQAEMAKMMKNMQNLQPPQQKKK